MVLKRFASWLFALCFAVSVVVWAPSVSAEVLPGFVAGESDDSYASGSTGPTANGDSALVDSTMNPASAQTAAVETGGVGAWLKNHGLGLLKGIGAGALGGLAVAAGAFLLGAGAPVILGVAGLAVLGGAIYGAVTGSASFNWAEAITSSVVSGVSYGVGALLGSVARPLVTKAAIAATDILGGGVTTAVGYLTTAPDPTAVGTLKSFAVGAGLSAGALGLGALAGKVWNVAKGAVGRAGAGNGRAGLHSSVEASLAETTSSPSTTTSLHDETRARVLQNINESRRAREASRFSEYAQTEAQLQDIANWRATHGYQYDVFTEGPLGGRAPGDPARNFYGMRYNEVTLAKDTVLYRAGQTGKPLGQWFTYEPPISEANVRIDNAVKLVWLKPNSTEISGTSPIDMVYAVKIPKGTVVYEGPVGSQGGPYLGGEQFTQVYVAKPWTIDGVEVVGSWRIVK